MPSRASVSMALLLAACGGGPSVRAASAGYDETGIASWYGEELAGRPTASGERFDPAGLTLAHRTLPLGTLVEIIALATGRSVAARVNDRGPGRRDRLIDLSRGAARLLGTDRDPLAHVRVRVVASDTRPGLLRAGSRAALAASPPLPAGRYWLQVATFASRDRAQALADMLGGELLRTGHAWRVRLGPLANAQQAARARDDVAARGYGDAQLLLITPEYRTAP